MKLEHYYLDDYHSKIPHIGKIFRSRSMVHYYFYAKKRNVKSR